MFTFLFLYLFINFIDPTGRDFTSAFNPSVVLHLEWWAATVHRQGSNQGFQAPSLKGTSSVGCGRGEAIFRNSPRPHHWGRLGIKQATLQLLVRVLSQ